MFELVRTLNSAIDAGRLGAADVPAVRETFAHFDRVLGVLGLRRVRGRTTAGDPVARSSA